ncbi:MAG: hypothetical protein IV084_07110 [Rugosibacter sp.]|nr:hypothetical protein [Rugosibacter sp.]
MWQTRQATGRIVFFFGEELTQESASELIAMDCFRLGKAVTLDTERALVLLAYRLNALFISL